jgi:hypothetical protein
LEVLKFSLTAHPDSTKIKPAANTSQYLVYQFYADKFIIQLIIGLKPSWRRFRRITAGNVGRRAACSFRRSIDERKELRERTNTLFKSSEFKELYWRDKIFTLEVDAEEFPLYRRHKNSC